MSLVLLPAFLVLPNLSVFAFLALAPGHCLELGLASCSDLSVLRGMDPPGAPVKRACCCQRGSTDRNGGGGGRKLTPFRDTAHPLKGGGNLAEHLRPCCLLAADSQLAACCRQCAFVHFADAAAAAAAATVCATYAKTSSSTSGSTQ